MMKRTLALAAAVLAVSAVSPAVAAPAPPGPATLTVTGQATISRAPDQARIDASIATNDDSSARALSDNNAHYSAVLAKLAAAGVPQNAVKTTGLSTYFNARPADAARADGGRYGYIVTRNLQIVPPSLTATGAAIDAIAAAGATTINGVAFGLRDPRAAQRGAIAAAVQDAGEQARALAAAAGVRIVRILQIGNEPSGPRPFIGAMRSVQAAKAPVPTDLPPDNVDVQATITITYEIR